MLRAEVPLPWDFRELVVTRRVPNVRKLGRPLTFGCKCGRVGTKISAVIKTWSPKRSARTVFIFASLCPCKHSGRFVLDPRHGHSPLDSDEPVCRSGRRILFSREGIVRGPFNRRLDVLDYVPMYFQISEEIVSKVWIPYSSFGLPVLKIATR